MTVEYEKKIKQVTRKQDSTLTVSRVAAIVNLDSATKTLTLQSQADSDDDVVQQKEKLSKEDLRC